MSPLGHPLITFGSIPSTQDWVRAWAEVGAPEGLTVQAREQTRGRGRGQRRWWSPPGAGLYLSLLLRPTIAAMQAAHITMLAALAVIDTCSAFGSLQARPKWPNDVLLQGRKLAGILSEQSLDGTRLRYIIVGIGLNVNTDFSGTPLAPLATSLFMATGQAFAIEDVRDHLLAALANRYERYQAGISPYEAWLRRLEPVGRQVIARRPGLPDLMGLVTGATPEGALLLRDAGGREHTIWAADILPVADDPTG